MGYLIEARSGIRTGIEVRRIMTSYGVATPRSRPLGVAILAFLVGLVGFVYFVAGLVLALGFSFGYVFGVAGGVFGLSAGVVGIVFMILGLITVGVAVGLWHLRLWALILALLVTFIVLVSDALAGRFISFGFIFSLLIFVYLLAVSRHFRGI